MVKDEIIEQLKKAVEEATGLVVEPKVEISTDEAHGDYSSNVAMTIFSNSEFRIQNSEFKSPMELAEEIVKILNTKYIIHNTDRVNAVAPGFINFWLSNDALVDNLISFDNQKIGSSGNMRNKKIMVEFAQPNPYKEFHVGHFRNISIGESICRLLESQGAKIFRGNYQGDIGLHVAKAIYGIQNSEFRIQNSDKLSLSEKIKLLGKAYAVGNKAYEDPSADGEKAKKEIQRINASLYQKQNEFKDLWQKTRQWSLDYFDAIYKRLGSYFDRLFFESEMYERGKEIVLENLKKGIFEKSEGAIIFNGEKFGLHKRVFVTKEGFATYEGKEMALGFLEYQEFPFDLAIHVVAHEQAGYFKVVFKALELLDPAKFKDKEFHLSYGMVELKEGKMSSRMGNIITADWLIDETKARIEKEFPEMDEETAEKVAVGAVKYSMLKFSPASNIKFSFEESISLEGNSGPYLQYSFARTQSVLAKSGIRGQRSVVRSHPPAGEAGKLEVEERSLLRSLVHFPEVVSEAAESYAPNLICNYLFNLAQKFNLFYQKHRIIGHQSENSRLALTQAVGQTLKTGLYLLGIAAPERI